MERPNPTKRIILELTGGNHGLVSAAHHGLYETSLSSFYPHLDLDELIAFEASSWMRRKKEPLVFDAVVFTSDIYAIFNEVYKIGMPWLKKNKKVSERLEPLYKKLNPFGGKDLRDRLQAVDVDAVQNLKEKLQEPVNQYVFECQYQDAKMKQHGENIGIKIMEFQPVYPNKETTVPNFAAEIARIISHYPQGYKHLEKPQLPLP